MEIPMYQTQWHGIDLLQFPAAKDAMNKPAGPEFYSQFYAELGKRSVDPAFAAGKALFGPVCILEFLEPWEKEFGRKPKILSLGVGKGYVEEVWLKRGYEVTLQECQKYSIEHLLQKYPNARGAVGDVVTIQFEEKFDFVAIISLDTCLTRSDLEGLLKRARSWLAPNGRIIFQSTGVLSVRQTIAETIKSIRRKFLRTPAVFVGWWRSIGELCDCARAAGLKISGVFRFGKGSGPSKELARRGLLTRRLPMRRAMLIVMLFEHPDSHGR